jgi:hypothetical protein
VTQATPPPDDSDFTDSDRQWFDRLTGKMGAVSDSEAVRDADALRRVFDMEAIAAEADPELTASLTDQAHESSWQQVQFRLRRETARRSSIWWRRAGIGGALAAGVLVAVVTLNRPADTVYYDEPPILRGAVEVTRTVDPAPRRAAEALAGALRAAGVQAALHQKGKVFSVDAVVAADTPVEALDVLRRAGAGTAPGFRRLEFAPP